MGPHDQRFVITGSPVPSPGWVVAFFIGHFLLCRHLDLDLQARIGGSLSSLCGRMAPPSGKAISFVKQENNWCCNAGLRSDITISLEGLHFRLHKFPLVSRCGKVDKICQMSHEESIQVEFEDFPGGAETFLAAVKFCYGLHVKLSPGNIVKAFCAAEYLEMTREYGEDNLLLRCESFLHNTVLCHWKNCVTALQNSEPVLSLAEKHHVVSKCLDAISMMTCTDRRLFGWPMMMYGRLQSPGGSILWNGVNTGTRISTALSDWWFEDVSCLSIRLFEMLVRNMKKKGMRPENISRVVIYYATKYLPGLDRWMGGHSIIKTRDVFDSPLKSATVNERALIERVASLLPHKKRKYICRFLLALLRVALILGVEHSCIYILEEKIGMQLDMATLDVLLIPSYTDANTLYNVDTVERMLHHFCSFNSRATTLSPSSTIFEASPSLDPMIKVANLADNYMSEVASDENLKTCSMRSLVEALPDSARSLHDGLYRAIDIYLKEHPWISEKEKEDLCNLIDFQKLSMEACGHATQNERLPLRIVFQVLFFEQMQMRSLLAGCLQTVHNTSALSTTFRSGLTDHVLQRNEWGSIMQDNHVLKVEMETMISRVEGVEADFNKMKEEMRKVRKSSTHSVSPLCLSKFGCKLFQPPTPNRVEPTSSISAGQKDCSTISTHRKHFVLF